MHGYFDPITGELITREIDASTQPQNGQQYGYNMNNQQICQQGYIDPITGELISGNNGNTTQPQNEQQDLNQSQQYDYNMNNQQSYQQNFQKPKQPQNNDNRKKILLGVSIGCGALVVVGIIIFVVSQWLMSNPLSKIRVAATNTFKIGKIQEVLNPVGIVDKDGMSFDLLIDYDEYELEFSYAYQQSEEKLTQYANYGIIMDMYGSSALTMLNALGVIDCENVEEALKKIQVLGEITTELDKERYAFSIPKLNDTVYTYYYTEENDGYYADEFKIWDKYYEHRLEDNKEKVAKIITKILIEELKNMEIEELEKEEFEINDKDVECGGYLLTITEDNVLNVLEQLVNVYDEYYADDLEAILDEMDINPYGDLFDELECIIEEMPDIEISFYIYRKQFACIKIEADNVDGACYLNFQGGEYPLQNMEIVFENDDQEYTILKTEGNVKNQIEKTGVIIGNEEICEMKYNQKTGDLEVYGRDYLDMRAVITRKKNTIAMEIDEVEILGIDWSGSSTLSSDVDIKSLRGKEFDMGNATEEDWEELFEELTEELGEELMRLFDLNTYLFDKY